MPGPISGGVVPPICTPLTPDRELDVPSLERLCAFQLEAGVTGVFVAGSTGEVAYLPDDLRRRVLEVVVGTVAGSVPVLAGVVDTTTPRVIDHARRARSAGASGVVATAPFYAPTAPPEIDVHFRALAAAVDLPVLAYDIPSAVHSKLTPDLLAGLASDGVIAGTKDSSGDLDGMRRLLELTKGTDFPVFSGSETMADIGLQLGAHGIVPGIGNVDPHGYVRLYDAVQRGDLETAATEQRRLRGLFAMVTVGDLARMGRYSSAIGAFKAGLVHRGVISSGTTSLPMIPLNDTETLAVRAYLDEAGLL